MKWLWLCLCLIWPGLAVAQVLPALYDVTGVAGSDVLNIRANADVNSAIVATLRPDAKDVEVVALSPDGKWAQINDAEAVGWASLRFLRKQNRPDWLALQYSLECSGTEPFWTLFIDPPVKSAHINTPDEEGPEMDILGYWPGTAMQPTAVVQFASDDKNAIAVLRGQACLDGMSDQKFGISLDLFQQASPEKPGQTLHGCCRLAPWAP